MDGAVNAIYLAHNLAGYSDPSHSSLVIQIREGVLRECMKQTIKKESILSHYL